MRNQFRKAVCCGMLLRRIKQPSSCANNLAPHSVGGWKRGRGKCERDIDLYSETYKKNVGADAKKNSRRGKKDEVNVQVCYRHSSTANMCRFTEPRRVRTFALLRCKGQNI